MNQQHVIIFARAPRIGHGKRRLASDVGDHAAYDFYQANLKRLIQDLNTGPWQLHVAVASEEDRHHHLFKPMSIIIQPDGDLGHRMSTVLSQHSGCDRLIIGSDIPELDSVNVLEALTQLITHEVVFGPALDGGFWGVGCSSLFEPNANFMRNVRWSSPNALSETLATLSSDVTVAKVASLADVDDGEALARYLGKKK